MQSQFLRVRLLCPLLYLHCSATVHDHAACPDSASCVHASILYTHKINKRTYNTRYSLSADQILTAASFRTSPIFSSIHLPAPKHTSRIQSLHAHSSLTAKRFNLFGVVCVAHNVHETVHFLPVLWYANKPIQHACVAMTSVLINSTWHRMSHQLKQYDHIPYSSQVGAHLLCNSGSLILVTNLKI